MKKIIIIIFCALTFEQANGQGAASDLILNARVGISVGKVRVYEDSSFLKPTQNSLEESELVEVMSQTAKEYEDNAQNQKFRWYQVRSLGGLIGWVFGDGLAVIVADSRVENRLKLFHKKKVRFNSGFEQSVMWVAAVEGLEIVHQQKDYLNPIYKEFYLVATNERGKSVQINCAETSVAGKSELKMFLLYDVTGDGADEIILQRSSQNSDGLDNRTLEIHSFQGGNLTKIWEERMTLTYSDNSPSPTLFKYIEVDNQSIRVSYIDYSDCEGEQKSYVRCLDYVTKTYVWDMATRQFKILYPETKSPLSGGLIAKKSIFLRAEADTFSSQKMDKIEYLQNFQVLKHSEKVLVRGTSTSLATWLLVRTKNGALGWIPAAAVRFNFTEHAELLEKYYENPPVFRNDWKGKADFEFIKIIGKKR